MVIQVSEVGVNMISIPVQRIGLHSQVVSGEVSWWVPQVVELVPQYAAGTRRGGDYGHSDGKHHSRQESLSWGRTLNESTPCYSNIHWHTPVLYTHTNTVSSYPYCTLILILYPHTPYCKKFPNIHYKIELKVKQFFQLCQNHKTSKNFHAQQFFVGMITYLFGQ